MKRFLSVFLLLGGLLAAGGANAAGDIRFATSGSNVVVTISGTVDPTGLATIGLKTNGWGYGNNGYENNTGHFYSQVQCEEYGGLFASSSQKLTGPGNWGTGGAYPYYFGVSSPTGGGFGIDASNKALCLPVGYVAGQQLVGTGTLSNHSLGSLGLNPGVYTYTWGNATQDETLTVTIVPPPPTINQSDADLAINATTLTITGNNFDTTAGNNTVVFNNGAVGTVSAATSTQLTVNLTTPPSTTGSLTAVVTTNSQGSGSAVQVATVVPATQATLVVTSDPTSIYVNGTSAISASGGSGSGAVTYNVSGPCTLSDVTLTGTDAGDCIVTATKAADSTYAETSSQVTVAVSLAPVDCVVSSWSAYGACSASCGGGTQTQTRTIVTPDSNGGAACPALSQSQACNVQACEYQAPVTTPGGTVNAGITDGSFTSTQADTPTNPPAGQSFPYGVFSFTAATNTLGGPITITLTYPQALAAGSQIWKNINGTWLDYTSNVTFNQSRTTITYTITDGGPFDSDGLVNQSVTDPIGPAIAVASIPSLSEWAQLMLALMVIGVAWHFHNNRQNSY